MIECLSISLEELVTSGCLSGCTFSFDCHPSKKNDFVGTNKLRFANAAALSLLLAQAALRFDSGRCDDASRGINSTSLKLNNFFVKLTCSSSNVSECDDSACCDKSRKKDNSSIAENDDDRPLDFEIDPSGENDSWFDFLSELFDTNDGSSKLNTTESPLETNEGSSSVGAGQFSSCRNKSLCDKSSLLSDKNKFDNINAASWGTNNWTLLGMEVRVYENASSARETPVKSLTQDLQKIQHLGGMIYQVFLPRNIQTLPAEFKQLWVLEESSTDHESNNGIGLGQRFSKLRRRKENSLFSDLLEVGHYPVSICRLLSDMSVFGRDGTVDTPFKNVEDIIEDLEQMSSHPRLYLDDPEDYFFSSTLRFGLGCYGRKGQVTSILRVASTLEGKIGMGSPQSTECAQCILVSSIAGGGKTFLIQCVGNYLTSQGWIVIGTKFEIGLEHESRDFVSSAFDNLVATLIKMRNGRVEKDVEYSRCVTKAISEELDTDSICLLATFLPSIKDLLDIDNIDKNICGNYPVDSEKGNSYWRLVFLLSSLLGAILTVDCRIMIYFDDLQWSNSTMLALICEIVTSMGRLPHARKRLLFVGMHRNNEVSDSNPLTTLYNALQQSKHVNISSINLPSLSKNDVTDMMMTEMRLPRRLILQFSDIVHKMTSGHALFVVQLLNSLVRDSIIVYSPTKKRFHWDHDQLNKLPTWDSVASLIVSNLTALSPKALKSLKLLSCFGMQVHLSVIQHLGSCSDVQLGARGGIASSLPSLIDAGIIVEGSGSMIKFSHDLIRQQVYDSIDVDQRKKTHLCLGRFLGSKIVFENPIQDSFIESCREDEQVKEEKQEDATVFPQALIVIATDHINNASELITVHLQRAQFAGWNLRAATESLNNSNFQAALHYYKNGITFLAGKMWTHDTHQLSYSLCKGAAFTLLALGDADEVPEYAHDIIKNVPFDRSLEAQHLLIRSLIYAGTKNQETIDMALVVLNKLGFNIPSAPKLWLGLVVGGIRGVFPSISDNIQGMRKTDQISSQYNMDELIREEGKIDKAKRDVLNILNSIVLAAMRLRSPYLPLLIYETIHYSLKQGCVYGESALSFCYFGYFKIWFEDNYKEGRRWGTMALKILEKAKHRNPFTRIRYLLYILVLSWGKPMRESANDFFKIYELGIKFGEVESASIALGIHLRWLFLEGEKLSSLRGKYDVCLKQMSKYNKDATQMAVYIMDTRNIALLMGVPCGSFSVFDGMICDENSLLVDALSKGNECSPVVVFIYWARFFGEFWMGDYDEATKWCELALSHSKARGPMVRDVFNIMMRGIIAFQMHRDGRGEVFFNEGKAMLVELERWRERFEHTVKNKVLLLEAELYASSCEVQKAKEAYEASIRVAKKHGRIHEQGLAYELMGRYLGSIIELPEANICYKHAYECYMKWGAVAKAKRVQEDHNLDLADIRIEENVLKHRRGW